MSTLIKDNGVWKEPEMIYVKDAGIWKEVSGVSPWWEKGEAWARTPGSTLINALNFNGSRWWAGGYDGRLSYSNDGGRSWRSGTNPGESIRGITTNPENGRGVMVGDNGLLRQVLRTSTTWTAITHPFGTTRLNGIACANNRWVICGEGGTLGLSTSSTATSWVSKASGVTSTLLGVAHGAGKWVVVGNSGRIIVSTDGGNNWATVSSGVTEHLYSAVYGDGVWVAVGSKGTILTSSDAQVWTKRNAPAGTPTGILDKFNSVAFDGNKFYIVGSSGYITYSTSKTGISWKSPYITWGDSDIYTVAAGGDTVLCAGGLTPISMAL